MKYPMKTWEWKGMALHLCVANDCRFHMGTIIGPYKISTVGAWYPSGNKMEEIGFGRDYETYVFEGDSMSEIDGDGISVKQDANGDPYRADELAEKMHMEFCFKYAKGTPNER